MSLATLDLGVPSGCTREGEEILGLFGILFSGEISSDYKQRQESSLQKEIRKLWEGGKCEYTPSENEDKDVPLKSRGNSGNHIYAHSRLCCSYCLFLLPFAF